MSYEDECEDTGDFLESPEGFSDHAQEAVWTIIFMIILAAFAVSAMLAAISAWFMPSIERR